MTSGRCEVRHVTANLARRKPRAHGIIVDQSVAREVQKRRALLHGRNFVRTDHALRLRRCRDMDRDVVAACAQVEQVVGEAEVLGDGSCALGIEERVVAEPVFIPSASAAGMTRRPMAPRPITPSVFPMISVPANCFFAFSALFAMFSSSALWRHHAAPPTTSRAARSRAHSTSSFTAFGVRARAC